MSYNSKIEAAIVAKINAANSGVNAIQFADLSHDTAAEQIVVHCSPPVIHAPNFPFCKATLTLAAFTYSQDDQNRARLHALESITQDFIADLINSAPARAALNSDLAADGVKIDGATPGAGSHSAPDEFHESTASAVIFFTPFDVPEESSSTSN